MQSVISIICKTLAPFDDDQLIPTYGFGDVRSKDHSLVSFDPACQPVRTLDNVLRAYDAAVGSVQLSGPTSFAPAIGKAIQHVRESAGQYHILVILADGQVRQGFRVGMISSRTIARYATVRWRHCLQCATRKAVPAQAWSLCRCREVPACRAQRRPLWRRATTH